MARYNYDWSDHKLQRYIREGRGQGTGQEYVPWLDVHSIASRGRVSRVCGWKTNRVHHFLTDNELRYFYLLEWDDSNSYSIHDIREHYPLLDLYEMTEILDDDLLKKLMDRKTGTPHVLTSTFLVTAKDEQGKEYHFARNIKDHKDLEKPSIIQKYEVIRRYFEAKKIPWGLVTPAEIPIVKAKNIEWFHTAYRLSDWGLTKEQADLELDLLMDMISGGKETIRNVIKRFENEIHGEQGRGLLLFKHLLATKKLSIDLDKPFDINQSTDQVKVNLNVKGSDHWNHVAGG